MLRPRAILMLTWLLLGLGLAGPTWAQDSLTVYCNGQSVKVSPIVRNGATFYPVDPIVAALGATVHWDPNQKVYSINGQSVGTEPIQMGGHFYLPMEAIARAAQCAVTWDLGRNTIVLQSRADQNPNDPNQLSTPWRPNTPSSDSKPWDASLDGRLPSGWQFPNPHALPAPTQPNTPGELARTTARTPGDVFIPRSAQNAAFQVTVSNLEVVSSFRGYYQPRGGHVFAVVYLSQKNISGQAQVYPGKLHLQDQQGTTYESLEELSNFWPVIMRPYGINFGYLVYEIPETAVPSRMVLTTVGNPPLSLNL